MLGNTRGRRRSSDGIISLDIVFASRSVVCVLRKYEHPTVSASTISHQGKGHLRSEVDLHEVGDAEVAVEPSRRLLVDSKVRIGVL